MVAGINKIDRHNRKTMGKRNAGLEGVSLLSEKEDKNRRNNKHLSSSSSFSDASYTKHDGQTMILLRLLGTVSHTDFPKQPRSQQQDSHLSVINMDTESVVSSSSLSTTMSTTGGMKNQKTKIWHRVACCSNTRPSEPLQEFDNKSSTSRGSSSSGSSNRFGRSIATGNVVIPDTPPPISPTRRLGAYGDVGHYQKMGSNRKKRVNIDRTNVTPTAYNTMPLLPVPPEIEKNPDSYQLNRSARSIQYLQPTTTHTKNDKLFSILNSNQFDQAALLKHQEFLTRRLTHTFPPKNSRCQEISDKINLKGVPNAADMAHDHIPSPMTSRQTSGELLSTGPTPGTPVLTLTPTCGNAMMLDEDVNNKLHTLATFREEWEPGVNRVNATTKSTVKAMSAQPPGILHHGDPTTPSTTADSTTTDTTMAPEFGTLPSMTFLDEEFSSSESYSIKPRHFEPLTNTDERTKSHPKQQQRQNLPNNNERDDDTLFGSLPDFSKAVAYPVEAVFSDVLGQPVSSFPVETPKIKTFSAEGLSEIMSDTWTNFDDKVNDEDDASAIKQPDNEGGSLSIQDEQGWSLSSGGSFDSVDDDHCNFPIVVLGASRMKSAVDLQDQMKEAFGLCGNFMLME